ncbi:MAG: 5-dehydro-4-deoxy-D-glucuronate isomerase [Chthoniobacteraceae bacterium]
MHLHDTPGRTEYPMLDTTGLREGFLLDELFAAGELRLVYTDLDRALVGAACPAEAELVLAAGDELRAEYFCQRRELGVINLAPASGTVTVDGTAYELATADALYIGRGSRDIRFSGSGAAFYLVSYPAHHEYPTTRIAAADARHVPLGSPTDANERVIHQYIHPGGAQSCQLVMGWTELKTGSVWNTMPCHTHARRSEIYLYFDVPAHHAVVHLLGEPEETRALWLRDRQAVLSPSWSIHSGCGTASYKFVWAMGGENQQFDDMDPAPIATLR